MKRILYCTDFSENADYAFKFALEEAKRLGDCELHLLTVIGSPDAQFWRGYVNALDNDLESNAKKVLEDKLFNVYGKAIPSGQKVVAACRIGKAYVEIAAYAKEIDPSLIVLGRQGRGALESLLFGTVAEKVVRFATCPVLVIPMKNNG